MESRHGQQLGNYRLGRLLGQGAFASVYVAEDLLLRRHVAIKMLKEKILSQANQEAFLQEARTIASLRHPHILCASWRLMSTKKSRSWLWSVLQEDRCGIREGYSCHS